MKRGGALRFWAARRASIGIGHGSLRPKKESNLDGRWSDYMGSTSIPDRAGRFFLGLLRQGFKGRRHGPAGNQIGPYFLRRGISWMMAVRARSRVGAGDNRNKIKNRGWSQATCATAAPVERGESSQVGGDGLQDQRRFARFEAAGLPNQFVGSAYRFSRPGYTE